MAVEDRPSGSAIAPEQAGKAPQLVVCCVEVDAAQLQPAFDVLAMRGFEIAVVERQDVGPDALVEHARRHGVDALFVLARVAESEPAIVAPFEAALRTALVAEDRISALAIDWRDPMALVEHVAALAGTSRSTDAPILRTTTTSPAAGRRESTGPQRSIALVSPRTETGPQRNVAPARKPVTGPYANVPPPPVVASPKKEVTAGRRTLGVKVATIDPTPEATPAVVSEAVVSSPAAAAIEPIVAADPEPIVAAVEPVVASFPAPSLLPAEPPELETSDLPGTRPSRLHTVTAALRPLARMTGSRTREAWHWIASSRARILTISGIAASIVLVIAIASTRESDDAKGTSPTVATAVDPPAPSASNAAAVDKTAKAASDASGLVAQARARKELGVYEGIAFAPVHAQKRKFAAAVQQCADMNKGAIQGWRMPSLAELHELSVARVIDRGVYWSGTEGDAFGSHALIWSEKKSAAVPITKAWNGARALCVRDRAKL